MRREGILGSILLLGLAAAVQARELAISLSAGCFSARQDGYRRIYGPSVPVSLEVGFRPGGRFGVSAGLVRIQDRGSAVSLDGGDGKYDLKFRRLAIPLSVFYAFESGKLGVRIGAGVSYNAFAEDWESVDLGFDGKKICPRFFASVGYPVFPRWSLTGSVVYETVPAGAGSLLEEQVNLGGFQILAGVSFRVF